MHRNGRGGFMPATLFAHFFPAYYDYDDNTIIKGGKKK
jgi:hypothetical protein